MARTLRLEYPGAIYHVTSRGNARRKIYFDAEDREEFLSTLACVVERFAWVCHAYCLMDNHYHLLIETPDANLSRGMRQLNGVYTQRFNRRHRKVGHLFQGRYKAIVVERDSYLLELTRYIVLNPVRAKMVKLPEEYVWSSFRPTMGLEPKPACLTTDWIRSQFAKTQAIACERYAEFVYAGIGKVSPWKELKGQVLLGSEAFIQEIAPQLKKNKAVTEIPKFQRKLNRPPLKNLLKGMTESKTMRNEAMAHAHVEHGYTLAEISKEVGLHYATISRLIKAFDKMSYYKM
jgi:putative transposase